MAVKRIKDLNITLLPVNVDQTFIAVDNALSTAGTTRLKIADFFTVHNINYLEQLYPVLADTNNSQVTGWNALTPDAEHQFVSLVEKNIWNAKANTSALALKADLVNGVIPANQLNVDAINQLVSNKATLVDGKVPADKLELSEVYNLLDTKPTLVNGKVPSDLLDLSSYESILDTKASLINGKVPYNILDLTPLTDVVDTKISTSDALNLLASKVGQTQLTFALNLKADLVNGKVPAYQLNLTSITSSLSNKADLINGKIPATQLDLNYISSTLTNKADLVNGTIPASQISIDTISDKTNILIANYIGAGLNDTVANEINSIKSELLLKVSNSNPIFTGNVIVPTALLTDNSNKAASTAFVNGKLSAYFNGNANEFVKADGSRSQINKTTLGLSNVDNTADLYKPISLLVQAALDEKVDKSFIDVELDIISSRLFYLENNAFERIYDLSYYYYDISLFIAHTGRQVLQEGDAVKFGDGSVYALKVGGNYSILQDYIMITPPSSMVANIPDIAEIRADVEYAKTLAAGSLQKNANLSDLTDVNTARTVLGIDMVPNVDTRNPANIIQSSTYRFVTDTDIARWNSGTGSGGTSNIDFDALFAAAVPTQFLRGDRTWQNINKTTLGLSNVVNADTTNPANITQSASYRFVTDAEKSSWNNKEPIVTIGEVSQYYRGDKTWQPLNKSTIGLSNVPNIDTTNPANIIQTSSYRFVSDIEKSEWNSKEGFVILGNSTQYYRGDKTWQTLDKVSVGLSNVPNIDATNPINIVQTSSYRFVTDTEKTSWSSKESAIVAGTISQYYRGDKTWQTLNKAAVGLSNVVDVDTTNPANIVTTSSYRFVSDADILRWDAKMSDIGTATTSHYLRGDKTWQVLDKSTVGLENVANVDTTKASNIIQTPAYRFVTDVNISYWNAKMEDVGTSSTSHYLRGDKSWQVLDKSTIGLSNVPNIDATNPANITQDASHRFVSDTNISDWNSKLSATGTADISHYLRGDSTWQTLDKSAVGLADVPNIDATNPSNIAWNSLYRTITDADRSAWNAKESAISAGTTSQYYRGDKTWQTLDKSVIGLSNVVNVDATNPVNIVQTSLYRFVTDTEKTTWNSKEDSITIGTTSQYYRGDKTWQTLDKSAVGLANVSNVDTTNPANIVQTSNYRFVTDVEKSAWDAKADVIAVGTTSQYYRGDKTWQTLDKSAVGLSNVPNVDATVPSNIQQNSLYRFVSDSEKSDWNSREPGIIASSYGNFLCGDKTWRAITKSDISGLSNVQNVDTTNPANITQTSNYRFVTDIEKTIWDSKESAIISGTTAQYYRGDKTWQTLNSTAVGLSNVQNIDTTNPANIITTPSYRFVSDVNISYWNAKMEDIGVSTTAHYFRGDKTWQILDKSVVGLGNVSNVDTTNPANIVQTPAYRFVSDVNISYWNAKMEDVGVSTTSHYLRGDKTWQILDKSAVGLSNVPNIDTTNPNNITQTSTKQFVTANQKLDWDDKEPGIPDGIGAQVFKAGKTWGYVNLWEIGGAENIQNVDTTNPANILWNSTYSTVTTDDIARWNGYEYTMTTLSNDVSNLNARPSYNDTLNIILSNTTKRKFVTENERFSILNTLTTLNGVRINKPATTSNNYTQQTISGAMGEIHVRVTGTPTATNLYGYYFTSDNGISLAIKDNRLYVIRADGAFATNSVAFVPPLSSYWVGIRWSSTTLEFFVNGHSLGLISSSNPPIPYFADNQPIQDFKLTFGNSTRLIVHSIVHSATMFGYTVNASNAEYLRRAFFANIVRFGIETSDTATIVHPTLNLFECFDYITNWFTHDSINTTDNKWFDTKNTNNWIDLTDSDIVPLRNSTQASSSSSSSAILKIDRTYPIVYVAYSTSIDKVDYSTTPKTVTRFMGTYSDTNWANRTLLLYT